MVVEWSWDGRGIAVGAAVLVLVVTVYVGGARFVGGGVVGAAGAAEAHHSYKKLLLPVTTHCDAMRDAAGLVLRAWTRAYLLVFCERLSVL
jgi:hypothetical protein